MNVNSRRKSRAAGGGGPRHVIFLGVKRPELENPPPMRRGKPKRR